MSKNAPTNAPTSWKNHWNSYHEPRQVPYQEKIYWAVTKPAGLWKKTNRDKKLSSGTSDPRVAVERKWHIAAKIYQWFDDEFAKLDTPQVRYDRFMLEAEKLWAAAAVGVIAKDKPKPKLTELLPTPEADDVIRLFNAVGVKVPESMLDLVNDEAKFWLMNHPSFEESTKTEQALLDQYGDNVSDVKDVIDQAKNIQELFNTDPALASGALSALMNRPSIRGTLLTDKDKELAAKLSGGRSAPNTSVSSVGKRYIKESKWNRNRTKSGAKLAIERFARFVGTQTDIEDITIKDAYAFAKWMEDELDAANKSIKGACSYVRGMFTWATTQSYYPNYIHPAWTVLEKIGDYGRESEEFIPFRDEQLLKLFALAKLDGKGKLNRRDHLLLSMLVATGCRLDEAALLTWENIIMHKQGWHYIDLTKAIVKNRGSKRLLPIPDKLQAILPTRGHQVTVDGLHNSPDDRLFDYSIDSDGKAARAASQALGRQIAKIKSDKQQVTHSLRGNLKDLLRDAGVSKELNHYITGHSQGDVGSNYGIGHSIELRYEALNLPEHPYLKPY